MVARSVARILAYLLLVTSAGLALIPFGWLLLASLKPSDQIFSAWSATTRLTLENFQALFSTKDLLFGRYILNSIFLACTTVVLQLFFSSLAGFALAKYEFAGKKWLMLVMLATVMIPGQMTLGPSYALLYQMHLVDTYAGLLIPAAASVFGIFLFRQAILQVPDELLHAARIDGCTEFGIYWNIVMPVTRPMIGAFSLMTFMGSWNSFLWPAIILQNSHRHTLPIALSSMVGLYSNQYGLLMAGTFLAVLPVIVLFLLLQKEFVAGLTAGAVKG
jgi:ABC-type glycerol-3-phosphate transport system permease component